MQKRMVCWVLLMLVMNLRTPSLLAERWVFSIVDAGAGLGVDYERSDLVQEHETGGFYSIDFGSLSLELDSPGGFGVGTKIYETIEKAFLPVYAYYTVYSRTEKLGRGRFSEVRSPHVYLFAGGTAWGRKGDYVHAGVDAVFGAYSGGIMPSIHDLLDTDDLEDYRFRADSLPSLISSCIAGGCVIAIAIVEPVVELANAIPLGYFGVRGGVFYSPNRTNNGKREAYSLYISFRAALFGFH